MNGKPFRFYPSSSAFAFGTQVQTEWSSGCVRNIYLDFKGLKQPFPIRNAEAGASYEAMVEDTLIRAGYNFQREVPVQQTLRDGIVLSGRIDFILEGGKILELKSCNSPSSKTKHLSKGLITTGNLAQVVTYMLSLRQSTGTLRYGEVKVDKKTGVPYIGREVPHHITLWETGRITINGNESVYTVQSLFRHRELVLDAILKDILPDRPYNESKFNGPCARCPWNATCTSLDEGRITTAAQFVQHAKEHKNDDETRIPGL